jgi:hypothetical protein
MYSSISASACCELVHPGKFSLLRGRPSNKKRGAVQVTGVDTAVSYVGLVCMCKDVMSGIGYEDSSGLLIRRA